jgi:hypothetical protein
MKSAGAGFLALSLMLIMISSCATVKTEQEEPISPGELRLVSVHFPEMTRLRQSVKYMVTIKFQSDIHPEVRRACLYWDDRGPYCSPVAGVDYGERTIRADVATADPGYHIMKCYVLYLRGEKTIRSNMIETTVDITK